MSYTIRVSFQGEHLFTVDNTHLSYYVEASRVYKILKKKFLIKDGFKISIYRNEAYRLELTEKELLRNKGMRFDEE